MAGITALNKNGRYAFGGGGSYVSGSGAGKYQGGSGAPGSAESKGAGGDGGYNRNERQLTGADYQRSRRDFERGVASSTPKSPKEKKPKVAKTNKLKNWIGDTWKDYNKFRYDTVNALIPGQKDRTKRARIAYAKYLKDLNLPVPENLLDEELSNFWFDGAFDKNQITDPRPSMRPDHMDYGTFMATRMGSPGIKYSGNVGGIGDKYVTKYEILADGSRGKPLEYGYTNIDSSGNRITGVGGEGQYLLPINYGDESVEEETQEFVFDPTRFGAGAEAADVTRASYDFNQGGRVPRNMGGIMNVVPRQGYFLGGIGKSIGKALGSVAKAAGKVLKSDLGKMAMLYGAGAMAGSYGLKGSLFSKGMFNPMNMKAGLFGASNVALNKLGLTEMAAKKGLLANLGLTQGYGSLLPTWKGGIAAMTALPFLMPEAKQDPSLMTDRGGRLPDFITGGTGTPRELRASIEAAVEEADGDPIKLAAIDQKYNNMLNLVDNTPYKNYALYADGGRIRAEEGGLMNLGGMEKDYRAEGGFVPIGKEEKADDVPARLSVNEFVFTADAVRNAGGGDIDKGAEVMENMMKNLENGGTVSEESQGNTGAQEMFSVSERIGEVI